MEERLRRIEDEAATSGGPPRGGMPGGSDLERYRRDGARLADEIRDLVEGSIPKNPEKTLEEVVQGIGE